MSARQWTATEARAWRTFVEMHHRLERHLNWHLNRDFGLSGPEFEILVNVSEAPHGRIAVADLLQQILWERSRLSHQLRRMAGRGLLRRDTRNRRRHVVELTEAGWSAIRTAAPANADRVHEFFVDVLGPGHIDTMAELSAHILEALNLHIAQSCAEPPPSAPRARDTDVEAGQ